MYNGRSSVSFARKNDSEAAPVNKGMTVPLGKSVLVTVLMAMNPTLLNSAATINNLQAKEGNPEEFTMIDPAQVAEHDDATYAIVDDDLESMQDIKKLRMVGNI